MPYIQFYTQENNTILMEVATYDTQEVEERTKQAQQKNFKD